MQLQFLPRSHVQYHSNPPTFAIDTAHLQQLAHNVYELTVLDVIPEEYRPVSGSLFVHGQPAASITCKYSLSDGKRVRHLFEFCAPVADAECSICLAELPLDSSQTLKACGHSFHTDCLSSWTRTGAQECPYCRSALEE